MAAETRHYEQSAREEMINIIREGIGAAPGCLGLLGEEFGIQKAADLENLPFSRLHEISKFVETLNL